MSFQTKPVQVGDVVIGGGAPVTVQSMTRTDTSNVKKTLEQVEELVSYGCEIIRVAVPGEEAAKSLREIKSCIDIPLVADIHFDFRLALLSLEQGVDKIRINPGNIGGEDKLSRVVTAARQRGAAIRIGVNAGSLEREIKTKHGKRTSDALVESAVKHVKLMEKYSFDKIVISLKAPGVLTTVQAYEKISSLVDYPLHLGITEAGRGRKGIVKSSLGIGSLLLKGIGDTIRVSLTGEPVEEVLVGREILQSTELRQFGPEIIACPMCGRCRVDLASLLGEVEEILRDIKFPLKIAVMGCPVNGPGEAREADIGISGGEGLGIIFKEGKVVQKVPFNDLFKVLREEIEKMIPRNE